MVVELFAIREPGMVTVPFAATRNTEVVAVPFNAVDEAISKSGVVFAP